MARTNGVFCIKTSWHDREAYLMGNDMVRLRSLTGGGHIADLHFDKSTGFPSLNPFLVQNSFRVGRSFCRREIYRVFVRTLRSGGKRNGNPVHIDLLRRGDEPPVSIVGVERTD